MWSTRSTATTKDMILNQMIRDWLGVPRLPEYDEKQVRGPTARRIPGPGLCPPRNRLIAWMTCRHIPRSPHAPVVSNEQQ